MSIYIVSLSTIVNGGTLIKIKMPESDQWQAGFAAGFAACLKSNVGTSIIESVEGELKAIIAKVLSESRATYLSGDVALPDVETRNEPAPVNQNEDDGVIDIENADFTLQGDDDDIGGSGESIERPLSSGSNPFVINSDDKNDKDQDVLPPSSNQADVSRGAKTGGISLKPAPSRISRSDSHVRSRSRNQRRENSRERRNRSRSRERDGSRARDTKRSRSYRNRDRSRSRRNVSPPIARPPVEATSRFSKDKEN